ncbi:Protein kinase-like domain protein [Metarhizium rileyi]|uniref:Protein kinase-like domain protein n=1 Tax=Metarhizium rileyi (strain RCEF 4871) TaxID=1649241 RepID=A0A166Y3I0_METRR|nr:Protein kinase-like domain protein [Metarhizium rileyi RCEF 4871]
MSISNSACNPIKYDRLTLIGYGGSAIVYGIDESTVLKEYFDETDEGIMIECNALGRLGSHSNIVQCLGKPNKRSIILERGEPLIRNTTEADIDQKLRWIGDAAIGLQYMHHKGIIHADFGCSNMILIENRVKIIDFGGCSIDGDEALAGYNWYNCRVKTSPNLETDIFAFGCAVFEILSGKPPYHELEACPDRDNMVQNLYAAGRFPEINDLPLREIMLGCWHGTFRSMEEVVRILDEACPLPKESGNRTSLITRMINQLRTYFRPTSAWATRQIQRRTSHRKG